MAAAGVLALAVAACGGGDEPNANARASEPGAPARASSAGAEAPKARGATSDASAGAASGTPSQSELVARGERIYNVNCIACHHRDPTQDGGLGPAIAGSPRALVEARVLRGEYPPGYTPKRDTRLMIPLPHLEPEIDALTAFLASRAQGGAN
ncbi:MAG: cytochrome c [Myxococcota bacterium]